MLVSVSQDFKIKAISLKEQPCLKCIIISINIDAIGKKDPSVIQNHLYFASKSI